MSLWEKLGFSLVISEYALKYMYAGLDSSICSSKIPKRHIRCYCTIPPTFQNNFPGGACPPTPLEMLHGNCLQDSVLHESVEKAGVISCNIRICSEILWIRRFYLLTKNTKKTHQVPPNSIKISKFSRGNQAPESPSKDLLLLHSPPHLPCSFHLLNAFSYYRTEEPLIQL